MTMIGVLGAGQLGRMLALAGYPLGLRFRFFDPTPGAPAGRLAEQITADYGDEKAMKTFAQGLELITYEFENVPVEAARFLEQFAPVFPPPKALEVSQDRLAEKALFNKLEIPTPAYERIDQRSELESALTRLGYPAVLKTRRLGYDGKGQMRLNTADDIQAAWAELGGQPLILEKSVPFERELSVLAVRGRDGTIVYYPLVENHHRQGILRLSLAPAPRSEADLQERAESYARCILEQLDYCGVIAIELFETRDANNQLQLLANEIAPRVHNSGHWTIDCAATSQFTNHLLAMLGWPLGSTSPQGAAAMVNLIGELPEPALALGIPGVRLHFYDKSLRPGRKVGHINICASDRAGLEKALGDLNGILHIPELDMFTG
jgi:5-(carboxyamino)imidazole ribonucleotide synthase